MKINKVASDVTLTIEVELNTSYPVGELKMFEKHIIEMSLN